MVAYKVILSIAVVSIVAFIQINARPYENELTAPFEAALDNLTSTMSEFAGRNSELPNTVKNNLKIFHNDMKSELQTILLKNTTEISNFFKEATIKTNALIEQVQSIQSKLVEKKN